MDALSTVFWRKSSLSIERGPDPAGTANKPAYRYLPSALRIGIAQLDAQHDALFARLVGLKGQCLRDGVLALAEAEALLAALREHYASEELVADEIGIDFAEHARDHSDMLQQVDKLLHDVVDRRASVFAALRYIEYWFERHILQDDMLLAAASARAGAERR